MSNTAGTSAEQSEVHSKSYTNTSDVLACHSWLVTSLQSLLKVGFTHRGRHPIPEATQQLLQIDSSVSHSTWCKQLTTGDAGDIFIV